MGVEHKGGFCMKRFASVFLCLVLVCFGLVSCGKKIEMEESKTYHFEGYDPNFAIPKGWTIEQETKDFEKGPASGLFVKGITLKDGVSYNLTSFYIYEPNFIANHPFIPDFDEKKSTKFGNNYLYIPKIDSSTNTKRGEIYIDKEKGFAIKFVDFPNNEITPELEAIFNSFKI